MAGEYGYYGDYQDYYQGQIVDVQQQVEVIANQSLSLTLPAGATGQVYVVDAGGNPTPGNVAGDSNGAGLAVVAGVLTATLTQDLRTTASPTFVTITFSNPSSARTNLGIDAIATKLSKLDATAAPTVNDDTGDGYGIGSIWIDTTADDVYMATDVTAGAAVWRKLN